MSLYCFQGHLHAKVVIAGDGQGPERCFRFLKRTQIKIIPMYHWLSRRIESHVKICILALRIERLAELACDMPWHQIKRSLSELQVTGFIPVIMQHP